MVGGGTTLVGDPSGKDSSRQIMTLSQISENINKIKNIFNQFINLKKGGSIINNYEWLSDLNYINFLRDIGSKLTINKMLTYESVKNRLDREQALTFLEFNYMLLQSYDFYHLKKNYDCVLQMGGSDQWGNIINGIDLIRKILNEKGKQTCMAMGCYGIGVSRIAAAAIEQSNDEKGIIWPKSISPYEIVIISIGYSKNETIKNYTNKLYNELKNNNIDVLLDDRDISPGNMFSDADLIGIPYMIVIGKKLIENNIFEIKNRRLDKTSTINEKNITEKPSKYTVEAILENING